MRDCDYIPYLGMSSECDGIEQRLGHAQVLEIAWAAGAGDRQGPTNQEHGFWDPPRFHLESCLLHALLVLKRQPSDVFLASMLLLGVIVIACTLRATNLRPRGSL